MNNKCAPCVKSIQSKVDELNRTKKILERGLEMLSVSLCPDTECICGNEYPSTEICKEHWRRFLGGDDYDDRCN